MTVSFEAVRVAIGGTDGVAAAGEGHGRKRTRIDRVVRARQGDGGSGRSRQTVLLETVRTSPLAALIVAPEPLIVSVELAESVSVLPEAS